MKAILNFILSTLRRFFIFLRKPNLKTYKSLPTSQKFATILILLVLNLIFVRIWFLIFSLFCKDPELFSMKISLVEMGFQKLLLLGCLIAPFMEEFIFRFPLKYKRNYIFLLFSSMFISRYDNKANNYKIKRFYRINFGIFFYFMALFFAIVHFSNYNHTQELLLYLPFLVLSQFFIGLILGFVRIKFGFLWAVFYHALYNFILFTAAFSAMDESKQLENLNNFDNKKQKTEEASVYDEAKLKSLSEKFINFKEYSVESNKISLKITKITNVSVYSSYFVGITPDSTNLSMPIKNSVSMFMGVPLNDVLVNVSDSLVLNYQLKFKKHQKNSLKTKDLLLFHLVKALSLKLSYEECIRVSWQPVIINKNIFDKKTEGFDMNIFVSKLRNLNDYWSVMFVLSDSKIDVFNPDEEIFKDKTEKMKDLARELKSYGVNLKDVRTRHKLVLVE